MRVPGDLRYSSDHEWVRVDGARATIGITDHAQEALGTVVFVELPAVGTAVTVGGSFSEVESTKAVSDVYAPLTGTVVAVNEALRNDPEQINSDPYGNGWVCVIEMSNPGELDQLLDAAAYEALVEA